MSPDDRYITIGTFKIPSRPSAVSTFSNPAPRSPLPLCIFFLHSTTQIYLDFSSGKLSRTLHHTFICIYYTRILRAPYILCITLLVKTIIIGRLLRKYKNKYYRGQGRGIDMRYASFYSLDQQGKKTK